MTSATPTTNRQEAVRALAEQRSGGRFEKLLQLQPWRLAQRMGKRAFLIDDAKDIQEEWVKEVKCVGVTAGIGSGYSGAECCGTFATAGQW